MGMDRYAFRIVLSGSICIAAVFCVTVAADAQVARRAARGALGGAAVGSLSGGDAGKGAAWGAGMGAVGGAVEKRRDAAEQQTRQGEVDQAFDMGYQDALNGAPPSAVSSPSSEPRQGQMVAGAAKGALSGAAIGKLSDGDTGKGAAWGAGGGAVKGAMRKEQDAQVAQAQSNAVNAAYQEGYRRGMAARKIPPGR